VVSSRFFVPVRKKNEELKLSVRVIYIMRDDRERENDPLLFLALFLSFCRIDDQTLEHHHQHHADLRKKRPAEKSFLRRKKNII